MLLCVTACAEKEWLLSAIMLIRTSGHRAEDLFTSGSKLTSKMCCRLGSRDSSFDGMADISAALKNCTPYSPADIGTGDHPLSQGLQEPCLQDLAPKVQHCSSVSLSGGSSSTSSHGMSDTDAQLLRLWVQSVDSLHMVGAGEGQDDEEEGRFARKLQEFQKGTDMLRQQTSIS